MSFSQSVEPTMKKNYTSTNQVFEFRARTASSLWNRVASSTLKRFSRRVFSWKIEKHLGQLEWNNFVYLTVDEEKSQ